MNKKTKLRDADSNLVDASSMPTEYQDSFLKIQLERYEIDNMQLSAELVTLKDKLSQKDQQIKHLEELLKTGSVSAFAPLDPLVSDEELIALKQIKSLKEASEIRPLSLEEVKILDLLVKNKRLAQGVATGLIDTVKLPKDRPKLLQLAATKIDESGET